MHWFRKHFGGAKNRKQETVRKQRVHGRETEREQNKKTLLKNYVNTLYIQRAYQHYLYKSSWD